jgi:hypothetical protein
MRRWGFSTHGSYPGQGRVAAEQGCGPSERIPKYLEKNDNFARPAVIDCPYGIANRGPPVTLPLAGPRRPTLSQYRSSATPCDFQTTHRCIPAPEVS